MLEIDAAGIADATEGGIEIVSAPGGDHVRAARRITSGWARSSAPEDKLTAHNAAVWQHGLLVHVPAGRRAGEAAVRARRELDARRLALLAPARDRRGGLALHADRGVRLDRSRARVLLERGRRGLRRARREARVRLHPEPLARRPGTSPRTARASAEDAELDWVAGGFGSRKGKITIENRLAGKGATSRVTGAYFADGDQHLDYDTLQEHQAPNTTSDFAFKGVLRDRATSVWRGMIKVERDAQRTNAYQENRNLLLSPDAHADSIPGLEILANDVRCTHGATVSQVNRDELFYCMARGLSREEAQLLIVRGFYQEIFDRIELAPVRDALQSVLEARLLA